MSQTATEERRSALDSFAAKTAPETTALAPVSAGGLPAVYGAQNVAVHRDERVVLNKIRALAAAAGQDWYYRFPVKNKGKGTTDYIEGPTIKLANDVARLYGNCEVDCRVEDFGNSYLFHARFVDLETGYALTRPFQQRKGASRIGGADDARRDDIDLQIGASKATRNVIVNALSTFADYALEEAQNALVDKIGSDIDRYRNSTVERIGRLVPLNRVEAVIGRKASEWLAPDIARVIAMGKAIADGMATIDETFPPLGGQPAQTSATLDQFSASGGSSPVAAGKAAAPSSPQAPQPDEAAATNPAKLAIVTGLLKTATDSSLDKQGRLEALEIAMGMLEAQHPELSEFIGNATKLAAQAAGGGRPLEEIRKYMEAMAAA